MSDPQHQLCSSANSWSTELYNADVTSSGGVRACSWPLKIRLLIFLFIMPMYEMV